ncbi:TPA: hypothetical protein RJD49_002309 [Legionella pneumophila]|nr:hypothetical protein [Legionella pneumophila]HDV5806454.1 hypothetical protein [Legionella pneumophila]
MYSKKENEVKNDSIMDYSNEVTNELSLAERVFDGLHIYSRFKPSYFTTRDLSNLSLTSKMLYSLASPELKIHRAAQQLLTYVVLGEQVKAKAMIEKNPELLLMKAKAKDYSGRTIAGTAFQAAIGAGDKPMWEMMLPYFQSLKPGEALRQFHEQFPDGVEDEVSAEDLKEYYNAIALAIISDEDNGLSAIERLRKEITSQRDITQGKHFNLQHLIAAYQAYIDNFDAFSNWKNRDLFWQKVIGYVQRQMTTYDAQVHCSGIQSVLETDRAFSRTIKFPRGEKFFPLSADSGLGFDFACFSFTAAYPYNSDTAAYAKESAREMPGKGKRQAWPFKDYVEQKQACLLDLERHLSKDCGIIRRVHCS